MLDTQVESVVSHALRVGKENNMEFHVLPRLGVIDKQVVMNGWRFLPRQMDDSPIPTWADKRVKVLRDSGVTILQEIVGHNMQEEEEKEKKQEELEEKREKSAAAIMTIAGVIGFIVYAAIALFILALQAILTADPALIVVMEDGTWIAVAEWDE